MHFDEFRHAVLAPKLSSVVVSVYVPVLSIDSRTSARRFSCTSEPTLQKEHRVMKKERPVLTNGMECRAGRSVICFLGHVIALKGHYSEGYSK